MCMCVVFWVWKRKGWRGKIKRKKIRGARFCEHSRKKVLKEVKMDSIRGIVCESGCRVFPCIPLRPKGELKWAICKSGPLRALVLPVKTLYLNHCSDRSEAGVNRCVSFTKRTTAPQKRKTTFGSWHQHPKSTAKGHEPLNRWDLSGA